MIPSTIRATVVFRSNGQQVARAGYFLTNDGHVYWRNERRGDWRKMCDVDDLISVRVD